MATYTAILAIYQKSSFLAIEVHTQKSTPENPTRPKTKSILDYPKQELKI
jgi:hypothetical protein